MKFSQIPNELKYPPAIRSKLATIHSNIVSWVVDNFNGTYKERKNIIELMNSISYICLSGDYLPDDWASSEPFVNPPHIDDSTCRRYLSNLYILEKNVEWDVEISNNTESEAKIEPISSSQVKNTPISYGKLTPKEDLYIQSPKIPQFDKDKVWMSGEIEGDIFEIYESLPVIPTKQNEISITTDVDKFTKYDLLNLFPNQIIHTRAACMYEPISGVELDSKLGLILPIEGFTRDQLVSNIIEYPHLYRLLKCVENTRENFYKTVEIDGQLYDISDIWSNIPESSKIPYLPDFIKEYVVRRYLLERDYKHINHKYPLFGSLDPFLTLFMPSSEYESLGYNAEDIAKRCVTSRVKYKFTRSPIIERLSNA